MVVHRPRQEQARHGHCSGFARQVVNAVSFAFGFDGRAFAFPVGNQFVQTGGLEYISGQAVRADFRSFLNDHDGQAVIELQQADRCR